MARWSIALTCLLIGGLAGGLVAGPWLHGQAVSNAPIPKELTSYRDIVKTVLPAVVSIESRFKPKAKAEKEPQRRRSPFDDRVPEEFRKFFEDFGGFPEMPEETPRMGFGSGFLVDPNGVILTNYHVVAGAEQVEVMLQDGRRFFSRDIHGDRKTDLAIVRIDGKGQFPYLQLGDSSAMEIGDRVLAVGAPFGLTGSVTAGIVSAKGRNGLSMMGMYQDFLQTDAAINPGNSGGPLINLEGKVVGINTAIRTRSGGSQGVGLAIASNLAKDVVSKLENGGMVHRGYLGVAIRNLDPEVAERLGVKSGVVVGQIREGAPAAKGGLRDGDIITAVAGKPVKDSRELQTIVADLPLSKPTQIAVVRDAKPRNLQVTIEEQPENFDTALEPRRPQRSPKEADTIPLDKVGMQVTDLTPEKAEQLGYKGDQKGALITQVDPGSVADFAGLERDMVIAKVGDKTVTSASQAKEALAKQSLENGILLQVRSPQGGTSYLMLKEKAEK